MDPSTRYKKNGRRCISGWFARIDAEIFSTLLAFQNCQNIMGTCCEIGVHHGKSFIPLCLSLKKDELAMCIDVFGDQGGGQETQIAEPFDIASTPAHTSSIQSLCETPPVTPSSEACFKVPCTRICT